MRRSTRWLALAALLLLATAGAPAPSPTPTPTRYVVDGVDLGEASFTSTAVRSGTVHFHNGQYDDGDWPDVQLEGVVSGRVGAITVAIARVHYQFPVTGSDQSAEAFAVQDGNALWLGRVGSYSYFSDTGPWVETWYVASFAGDRFVVDTWDSRRQCDPRADWLATTYAVRDGKLVTLDRQHHHRAGTELSCVKDP